jgi:hypothetical protein
MVRRASRHQRGGRACRGRACVQACGAMHRSPGAGRDMLCKQAGMPASGELRQSARALACAHACPAARPGALPGGPSHGFPAASDCPQPGSARCARCARARSLVQRVPELAGARVHVRVLLCGDRAGRQRGRAPALPVVGPLPHPVPGAPGPAAAAPRLSTSWSRRGSRLLRTRAMGGQARGGRPDLVKPGARARGV